MAGSIWLWCILGRSRWVKSVALWRTRPGGFLNWRSNLNHRPETSRPVQQKQIKSFCKETKASSLSVNCSFHNSAPTRNAHPSRFGILPQPVIHPINNGAVCHPCWGAEELPANRDETQQACDHVGLIVPACTDLDTHTSSGDDCCWLIRSQVQCESRHIVPEGLPWRRLSISQPWRFACGLEWDYLQYHIETLCISAGGKMRQFYDVTKSGKKLEENWICECKNVKTKSRGEKQTISVLQEK